MAISTEIASARFSERNGISSERIEFVPRRNRAEYLRLYDSVDICLDPLPYNGITTTCDALWMGVPVVTLAGHTAAGRAGMSILSTLGMPEMIAHSPDQYVEIVSALAADAPRLAELRKTLRDRMNSSPLMDGPAFAEIWKSPIAHVAEMVRRLWLMSRHLSWKCFAIRARAGSTRPRPFIAGCSIKRPISRGCSTTSRMF